MYYTYSQTKEVRMTITAWSVLFDKPENKPIALLELMGKRSGTDWMKDARWHLYGKVVFELIFLVTPGITLLYMFGYTNLYFSYLAAFMAWTLSILGKCLINRSSRFSKITKDFNALSNIFKTYSLDDVLYGTQSEIIASAKKIMDGEVEAFFSVKNTHKDRLSLQKLSEAITRFKDHQSLFVRWGFIDVEAPETTLYRLNPEHKSGKVTAFAR